MILSVFYILIAITVITLVEAEDASTTSKEIYMNCSAEDASAITAKFLGANKDSVNCPKSNWYTDLYTYEYKHDLTFINIGFNKGYNFAVWMNIFAPWSNVNSRVWYNSIPAFRRQQERSRQVPTLCGFCKDCDERYDLPAKMHSTDRFKKIHMFGVDLNNENVVFVKEILGTMVNQTSVNLDRIDLHLYHAAGSDRVGHISVPKCQMSMEQCSIDLNGEKEIIPAISVDYLIDQIDQNELASNFSLGSLHSHRRKHFQRRNSTMAKIDILLIDTEGYDVLLLRGAHRAFSMHRVRMVIFEYHVVGLWPQHSLKAVINDLDTFEFDCFFTGRNRLWQLTRCWDDKYEIRDWSNVMCIHRDDLWYEPIRKYIVKPQQNLRH